MVGYNLRTDSADRSTGSFIGTGPGSATPGNQTGKKASPCGEERHPFEEKLKVLVVDDDPEALLDAVEVFRSGGFDVRVAHGGSEALEILASEPSIPVLFTDVLMRGMDGVTLGRKARELVPDIEVVLVSLLPSLAMEAHAGEPEEFSFLIKPFYMSEVEVVLRR